MYAVRIELFEGPLDLLLHLVNKKQMDITEISLASICDDFQEYMNKLRRLNLEIESSFLTVFASLLEIKSKMLLPLLPKNELKNEEEESAEHELVYQLREYKKFREAAMKLNELKMLSESSFRRIVEDQNSDGSPVLTSQLSAEDIMDIYVSVMRSFKERTERQKIIEMKREELSMPFMLRLIIRKLQRQEFVFIHQLFDSPPDRMRFAVTFLALLELARRKKISLVQNSENVLKIINLKKISRQTQFRQVRKMAV